VIAGSLQTRRLAPAPGHRRIGRVALFPSVCD